MRQQLAGEGTYFVAWSGDEPAGWVFLVNPEHASELALGGAQLSDLQVAAPYRGGGLGRALLDASEQAARDAGWDTIGLSVTSPIRTRARPVDLPPPRLLRQRPGRVPRRLPLSRRRRRPPLPRGAARLPGQAPRRPRLLGGVGLDRRRAPERQPSAHRRSDHHDRAFF